MNHAAIAVVLLLSLPRGAAPQPVEAVVLGIAQDGEQGFGFAFASQGQRIPL